MVFLLLFYFLKERIINVPFKWCIGFMQIQEILNFPLTRKIKTKRSQQNYRRMSGPQMLTTGCRLACFSLRCQVRGAGRSWKRYPSQFHTASFRQGESKLTEAEFLLCSCQTQTLAMASKPPDTPNSCLSFYSLLSLIAIHAQHTPIIFPIVLAEWIFFVQGVTNSSKRFFLT